MLLRTLIAVLTLTFIGSANATLINSNDGTYNTVLDSSSNLEWLDLTYTDNLSYHSALANFASDGWRAATETEFENMMDSIFSVGYVGNSYGYMQVNDGTALSDKVDLFNLYFGVTTSSSSYSSSYGFYLDDSNVLRLGGVYNGTTINQIYRDYNGDYSNYLSNPNFSVGTYLVKTISVPAPATIALLVLGLAGLRLSRKAK